MEPNPLLNFDTGSVHIVQIFSSNTRRLDSWNSLRSMGLVKASIVYNETQLSLVYSEKFIVSV